MSFNKQIFKKFLAKEILVFFFSGVLWVVISSIPYLYYDAVRDDEQMYSEKIEILNKKYNEELAWCCNYKDLYAHITKCFDTKTELESLELLKKIRDDYYSKNGLLNLKRGCFGNVPEFVLDGLKRRTLEDYDYYKMASAFTLYLESSSAEEDLNTYIVLKQKMNNTSQTIAEKFDEDEFAIYVLIIMLSLVYVVRGLFFLLKWAVLNS